MTRRIGFVAMCAAAGCAAASACIGSLPDTTLDAGPRDAGGADRTATGDGGDAPADRGCGDTSTDPAHCGTCKHTCAPDEGCHSGACGKEAIDVGAGTASACAIMKGGTVWCWGANNFGEVGVDSAGDVACAGGRCRPRAVRVVGVDSAVMISVGDEFACAVEADHTVWCWGKNHRGQLGHPTAIDRDAGGVAYEFTPTRIAAGLPPVQSVTCGVESACAVTTAGALYCWGNTGGGQLAAGDAGCTPSFMCDHPIASDTLTSQVDRVAIAQTSSENHACARKTDGTAWCWGDNNFDERGSTAAPGPVASAVLNRASLPVSDASAITIGIHSGCALRSDSSLVCWGENDQGFFGSSAVPPGSTVTSPVAGAAHSFASVSGTTIHQCGITGTGMLYCWGDDAAGELGLGLADAGSPDAALRSTPQVVNGFLARRVVAGYLFTVAIKTDGTVWAWGSNSADQTGHAQGAADMFGCAAGFTYCVPSPAQVEGLPF